MKSITSTTFYAVCISTAFASGEPTVPPDEKKNPLTFSGYIDTYYFGNFNNPKSKYNIGASGYERAFDQRSGMFQVGLAQAKLNYNSTKVDAVVDLTFGNHSDLGNYGNVIGRDKIEGKSTSGTALAIKQAFISYKPFQNLIITAGQFGTHIGYEVIDAPLNYHYSLSNLFNNGPFYHTGLKATAILSQKISITAGIIDGIDSKDDNNSKLGLMGQLALIPTNNLNIYLNWVGSDEGLNKRAYLSLFDLTTTYQLSSKWAFGLNSAYGTQNQKAWYGTAFYTNYSSTDKIGVGIRYEYFNNVAGARPLLTKNGNGTKVNSFTLTMNLALTNNLLFKPEFRVDAYPKNNQNNEFEQFENSEGLYTKNSQSTFGGALIFKF